MTSSDSPPPKPLPDVAIREPCNSCGVRCCNRYAVPITGFDVVRIMDHLGEELAPVKKLRKSESAHKPKSGSKAQAHAVALSMDAFVDEEEEAEDAPHPSRHAPRNANEAAALAADPGANSPLSFCYLWPASEIEASPHSTVFLFKDGKLEERLLILRRNLKTNYCHFSRHANGCAIWGAHPVVCKSYPFIVGLDEASVAYTKNVACPREWRVDEVDRDQALKVALWQHREIDAYSKMVRAWNANHARKLDGDERAFWEYLVAESRAWMKKEKVPQPDNATVWGDIEKLKK